MLVVDNAMFFTSLITVRGKAPKMEHLISSPSSIANKLCAVGKASCINLGLSFLICKIQGLGFMASK